MICFTVPCVPVAQPRQRHRLVTKRDGDQFVSNYTRRRDPVNAFKAAVQLAASQAYQGAPLEGPLCISLVFIMPRPSRLRWKTKPMPREWHASKPDVENIAKAVLDALTGLVWIDDAQVASLHCKKLYASGDEQPGAEVTVLEG